MLIVILVEYHLRGIRYNIVHSLTASRDRESSNKLFNTFLHADTEHLMRMKPGLRQTLLSRNEQMQNILNPNFFITILDTPFAIVFLVAIFYISSFIGWVVLLLILSVIAISFVLSHKVQQYTKQQLESATKQSSSLSSVEHFEMIRSNGAGDLLEQKYTESSKEVRLYKYLISAQQNKMQTINQTMTLVLSTLVIALGAREVIEGNIDFGMLIGMNILAAKAMMAITRPTTSIAALFRANQTKEFIDKFLNIPTSKPKGIELKEFMADLELRDLTYGYGKGPVIERLSVHIPKGSFIKVIGSNGAGKTTLSRLLSSLLHPKRGMILADGIDIRQLNQNWWYIYAARTLLHKRVFKREPKCFRARYIR